MTDPADVLFARVADEVSRTPTPPVEQVLRRSRRYRRRLGIPAALVPYAAVASVVLAVVGIAVVPGVLAGRGGPMAVQTDFAGGAPELGTIALPTRSLTRGGGPDSDSPVGGRADLLATTTTRLGTARLFGYVTPSGARCVAQDYVVPFINSASGSSCSAAGGRADREPPFSFGGVSGGTPGTLKDPPLRFGYAPPGTRVLELSSPGLPTVRAQARDAGESYGHRAYYIAVFPSLIAGTARALTEDGRELARTELVAADPAELRRATCRSARVVTLSSLQSASRDGRVYARTHAGSTDTARLRRLEPSKGSTNGNPVLPDDVVLDRLRRAFAAIGVMGPVETYDYRLAAVVIVGDGRACFGAPVTDLAQRYLDDSKGAAPLPSKYGK